MTTADFIWGGIIVAGGAFETFALLNRRDGDTLSETTRRAFRTRTTYGRAAFALSWSAFSVWYLGHILWGWTFPLS